MSGAITISGLASGLDTTSIINQLLSVDQGRVTLLQTQQTRAQSQLTAFQTLNTTLLAVLSDAQTLSQPSVFSAKTATSSNPAALTATASSSAAPGTYSLTVNSLAAAHQIASQGFADSATTSLGTGTLQIQVGSGPTKSLTLDATNDTLAGLRDAINAAGAGVTASIINDGSDNLPYRLLLTAKDTGAKNTIAVTGTLTGGTAPNFASNTIGALAANPANTYSGTAASGGTFTGTSNKSYLVQIVQGGSLAAATYRVSEDGGTTWGSTQSLAAGTINVYDDVHGSNLGVQASFADGTFAAGDRFSIDAFVPTVQAAADAQVAIGTGSGQLLVSSASNSVTDVVPGVTLTLNQADPKTPLQVSVQNDTSTVEQSIQSFVDHYNTVASMIASQTSYDATTQTAGILLGNSAVMKIQQDLRDAVIGTVPGLSPSMNSLTAIGITIGSTGQLSIDSGKLSAALAANPDGVARLFQAAGTSTNSKIAYVASSDATQANAAGYTVQVTRAATQGTLVGTSITDPAVSPVTIDASNDKLVLTVDGETSSVLSLAHKTYSSGADLANEVAAEINGDPALHEHVAVNFVDEGATGHFELATQSYGSNRSIALDASPSGGASALLGLDAATATDGQDVAGTVNGVQAHGTGQLLEVRDAKSPAAGLRLQVSLTPADLAGAGSALVAVTKGAGSRAQGVLNYLTDPYQGYVKTKEDTLTTQLSDYTSQINAQNARISQRRQQLVQQYAKLEATLAQFQSESNYLSAQFAALTGTANTQQSSNSSSNSSGSSFGSGSGTSASG